MINLQWIAPLDLHDHWDVIKEGLTEVNKHGDHWRQEDAYKAIKDGASSLHIGTIDGVYKGFLITSQHQAYDGMELFIWAAYSNENQPAHLLEITFPQLEEWAKNIKAKRIVFKSTRKGWKKNTLGFIASPQITYEKAMT